MDNTPEYLKGMKYTWNNTVPVTEKEWVVSTFISNLLNTAKLKPALSVNSVNSVPVSEVLLSNTQKLTEPEICNCPGPGSAYPFAPEKEKCCINCSNNWFAKKLKDLGVDESTNEDPNIIDGVIEGLRRLFSEGEPTPRQIAASCSKSLSCVSQCAAAYCYDSLTRVAECKTQNNCRLGCLDASCCPECKNIFEEITDCANANAYNCAPCWNNSENFNRCMNLFEAIQDAYYKRSAIFTSCVLTKGKTDNLFPAIAPPTTTSLVDNIKSI